MTGLVLIADPDAERAKRLAERCSARGLDCALALDGATALERTLSDAPAALAAHVDLPVIRGAQLAEILESNPRTRNVAVILLADAGEAPADEAGRAVAVASDPEAAARTIQALVVEQAQRPPEAGGEGDGGGVEGELAELPLTDLLQLFHEGRKTGTVEVAQPQPDHGSHLPPAPVVGRIFLRDGDVIQAVVGLVEGEKALFRLLGWDRGRFAFKPNPVSIAARIETPTRALLREGRRQIEEADRLAVDLPPLDGLVQLRIPRSRLPNAIHPLTREVLVVLELYARVREVVDHCSFPDYQVLRTLQTLVDRGLVELRREPELAESAVDSGLFSRGHVERLREWLSAAHPRGSAPPPAKVLVISPDPQISRRFLGLMERLPGLETSPSQDPREDDLTTLGRLAVGPELSIELVQMPVAERFAPLWPLGGHGALATLVPIASPVDRAAEAVRRAAATLRGLPRARLFYLLLLERGDRGATAALRENLSLLDDGPVFLIPLENDEKATSLLREMFRRVLP